MATTSASAFKPAKIFVPLDFSSPSNAALETASELALQFQSELYLLNVIPMFPIVSSMDSSNSFYPQQEFLNDARKEAAERLDGIVKDLALRGIKAASSVEVGDDVVGNIMRIVVRERAELVVISTHGLGGWRPMIFGSIAEKVIKLAQCPLLLLRAQADQ